MIKTVALTKTYKGGVEFTALKNANIEIDKGEFVAIVGKSGSGKSTLLHLLGLLDSPSGGEIFLNGESVCSLSQKQLAEFRNKSLGFVFQSYHLEPQYTVYKNVEMPLLIASVKGQERRPRVLAALERVGIAHKEKSFAKALSGGEMQRVAIARAIVNNPSLLLCDEPCGNLDSENSQAIMQLLKELNSQGITILLVSHSNDDVLFCTRKITLLDGEVLCDECI